MFGKLRRTTMGLVTFLSIYTAGCAGPQLYRPGYDVNSEKYVQLVKTVSRYEPNLETQQRLKVMTDKNPELERKIDNFCISSFRTHDKKDMRYSKWAAKSNEKKAREVIVYLSGMESHCGWFSECAQDLRNQDILVYGLDKRGNGLNARLSGSYGSWIQDANELISIAKKENPEADINLVSMCFGARIAAGTAVKNPKVDSITYISPGFDMKVDVNLIEEFLVCLSSSGISIPISSPIKRNDMFTKDTRYLDFIDNDLMKVVSPTSRDFLQVFFLKGLNERNLIDLNRQNKPTIVFLAGKDEVINIEKTKKRFQRLKNIKVVEYEDSWHTIFFGPDREKFINDLVGFIGEN